MENKASLFDRLEALEEKINNLSRRPEPLDYLCDRNDPVLISLISHGLDRVWRYCDGDRSDFLRAKKRNNRQFVLRLVLLALQILLPFMLIEVPFAWVLITVNAVFCLGYAVYLIVAHSCKIRYEYPNSEIGQLVGLARYAEYDDNGIVAFIEEYALIKIFRVVTVVVLPITILIFLSFSLDMISLWQWFVCFFCGIMIVGVSPIHFWRGEISYILYFVSKGDYEISIPYNEKVKELMRRNNLK